MFLKNFKSSRTPWLTVLACWMVLGCTAIPQPHAIDSNRLFQLASKEGAWTLNITVNVQTQRYVLQLSRPSSGPYNRVTPFGSMSGAVEQHGDALWLQAPEGRLVLNGASSGQITLLWPYGDTVDLPANSLFNGLAIDRLK